MLHLPVVVEQSVEPGARYLVHPAATSVAGMINIRAKQSSISCIMNRDFVIHRNWGTSFVASAKPGGGAAGVWPRARAH